jgi:hypothetical protein
MLSQAYMTERDPVKLKGLHGRLKLKLSRTGGAMSDGTVKVITAPFQSRSNSPVAPVASRQPASHGSPSASSAVATPTDATPRTPRPLVEQASEKYANRIANFFANGETTQANNMLERLKAVRPDAYNLVVQKLKSKGFKIGDPKAKKSLKY